MYGLKQGALAHTEQNAIKGPKITSVKPFKQKKNNGHIIHIYVPFRHTSRQPYYHKA